MSGEGSPPPSKSRRQFLEDVVGAAVASLGAAASPGADAGDASKASPTGRARVVVVRDPGCMDSKNQPIRKALREMIVRGLCLLTDQNDSSQAWRKLISPDNVVGLKVNCLGGPTLCTHPALAEVVAESLTAAGIPSEKIIMWDRTDVELARCGFRVNKSETGPRCFGTPAHESETIRVAGVTTRLSCLATRDTTAFLNLSLLKAHTLAGFSGALKNELGCVQNPADFHAEHCRGAADVCALDAIARKRRLVICDALRPLYDKGPTDMPSCRWNHGALILATDPVAADLVGRAILEEKRKAVAGGKPWPILPPPTHLDRAIELGLGAASLAAVELVEA